MNWLLLLGPLVSPLVSLAKRAIVGAVGDGAKDWIPAVNAGVQVAATLAANYVGPAVIAAVTGGDPSAAIVSAYEAAVIGIVNAGTGMATYELWSRYAE